jgi:hypothetical protein
MTCHQCGCSIVGEIKKQKYVYYHCTGYADKCRDSPAACRRRYVREEVLEKQFTDLLGHLQFDDEVVEWVREALYASHADERREHEQAIRRLQAEHKRIGDRINAMYLDKLDGRVDGSFFDKTSAGWREEQSRCLREIERHQSAEQSYMDEGVQPALISARFLRHSAMPSGQLFGLCRRFQRFADHERQSGSRRRQALPPDQPHLVPGIFEKMIA